MDDCLFWWPAKKGDYSVKSSYWLGRMGRHRVEVDELDEDSKDTWRMEVLAKRHIAVDTVCGCCGHDSESVTHALFFCEKAATTWSGSEFASLVREAPDSSFGACLRWLNGKVSTTQLQKIMAITWAIWFCRNKWLYEQQDLNGTVAAARFVHLVEEFGNYATHVRGSPPFVQPTVVGSGAIVLTVTRWFEGGMEAEVAEALAAKVGLEVVRRFGLNKVWLESDSLNVVKKVNTTTMGFSPLFLIINDIVELSNSFHAFTFSHVRRAGNTVAHLVARWDAKGSSELVCMAPFPQSISVLAELDLQ
ncbi:E3 UFM1-protein ligase 1-like protein [Bienertia sinuspersici]